MFSVYHGLILFTFINIINIKENPYPKETKIQIRKPIFFKRETYD